MSAHQGEGYYLGKQPYLYGGGTVNLQPNQLECEKQCSNDMDCKVGTFITSGDRKGECWLATDTLPQPAKCSMPCESFVRIAVEGR